MGGNRGGEDLLLLLKLSDRGRQREQEGAAGEWQR